jgi:hypothetical protein
VLGERNDEKNAFLVAPVSVMVAGRSGIVRNSSRDCAFGENY